MLDLSIRKELVRGENFICFFIESFTDSLNLCNVIAGELSDSFSSDTLSFFFRDVSLALCYPQLLFKFFIYFISFRFY